MRPQQLALPSRQTFLHHSCRRITSQSGFRVAHLSTTVVLGTNVEVRFAMRSGHWARGLGIRCHTQASQAATVFFLRTSAAAGKVSCPVSVRLAKFGTRVYEQTDTPKNRACRG